MVKGWALYLFSSKQVYFKATQANGSWSTYVKSFIPSLWMAFGGTVVLAMGVMVATYVLAVRTGSRGSTKDRQFDGFDIFGSCFIIYGALCQQGTTIS